MATCRRLRASLDALEKQARLAQQGSASASSEAPDGDVGSEGSAAEEALSADSSDERGYSAEEAHARLQVLRGGAAAGGEVRAEPDGPAKLRALDGAGVGGRGGVAVGGEVRAEPHGPGKLRALLRRGGAPSPAEQEEEEEEEEEVPKRRSARPRCKLWHYCVVAKAG